MAGEIVRAQRSLRPWIPSILVCLIWLLVICWALARLKHEDRVPVVGLSLAAAVLTLYVLYRTEQARWIGPTRQMTERIQHLSRQSSALQLKPASADFVPLAEAVDDLRTFYRNRIRDRGPIARRSLHRNRTAWSGSSSSREFESAFSPENGEFNLAQSGDYSTVDMVNRLDPQRFVWIESSVAEQSFLGWTLDELRKKSFLEIVHPDDRQNALSTLIQAVDRGESLGQVVRIETALGEAKDIELNVGARYDSDQKITHLRCHLTDVTEKVRSERELRLRTEELTRVNEKLLKINRELEELKDRYSDLYHHAPAMYFSLDTTGKLIECNQTLLNTLELSREDLIDHPYETILPLKNRSRFRAQFQSFLNETSTEVQTPWQKGNGETIVVWILASAVRDSGGKIVHVRCVAQDVTTKRRLEAELQRKNESLARANAELSLKNRELDDFVYVVSHDLQEPLRTLIAFSDFLRQDYGDRFDDEGREYVQYLIDASRRMRAMILALLKLSRAGKVIDDFAPVDMGELLAVVKTDLRELIRAKNGEIRLVSPLPLVWGDRNRLGQLFANLLTNALKYNRSESPWVEVGMIPSESVASIPKPPGSRPSSDVETVTLFVRDNGIGIDPEFHQTIFQLFRRLHTQDEYEGTGAGLAISFNIVQAHGGEIWVDSQAEQGSTFYIRLRCCPPHQAVGERAERSLSKIVAEQDELNDAHTV